MFPFAQRSRDKGQRIFRRKEIHGDGFSVAQLPVLNANATIPWSKNWVRLLIGSRCLADAGFPACLEESPMMVLGAITVAHITITAAKIVELIPADRRNRRERNRHERVAQPASK